MPDPPVLIETVRVRDGTAPLWSLHLRRLEGSGRALGVAVPPDLLSPAGGGDRVCRLEVGVGGLRVSERPVGSTAPVRLITSDVPHPGYPHKTTSRQAFERAARAAEVAGGDDALLLTSDGLVAEGTIWCLFWWEGDSLAAPPLDLGILPGVSRARIEELAGPLIGRRVARRDLDDRALFLANAARGIVEVSMLDGVPVPADARTAGLAARFWG